jgi:ring-1,2-phenylacetyl-CoA epoxidase subunit PaaC
MSAATALPRRRSSIAVTNPQLQDVDPVTRGAYGRFLLAMADSELVIGHRHSEWTGFAPSAEEDVAFSSIAQDEMGHAHLYYALITGATEDDAVDRLALDRGPRQMRHLPLLHAANGDWYFTIARHVYWDAWEDIVLSAALWSKLPLLASAAQRVLNEEVYHEEHATQWLELLSSRRNPHARLVAAMRRVVDIGGNPALRLDGLEELGALKHLPGRPELAEGFAASLRRRLEHVGRWNPRELNWALEHLNSSGPWPSPRGLRLLHDELTGMRRAHPGATW